MKIRPLLAAAALIASPALAQSDADPQALASWVAVDYPAGYETRFAPELARRMPGWSADRWGNLVRRVGTGSPRRLVACALDAPALAATRITADGYLRVHRIGAGPDHPLWDQAFEAQPVRILTHRGPVAGVVARPNAHFGPQHRDERDVVTADDLWVDVGAESAREAADLGIELLDPVTRHLPPWHFAGEVAGPAAGSRIGCAVVATLAAAAAGAGATPDGETAFVMSAQSGLGWVGLSSRAARSEPFHRAVLLAPGGTERVAEPRSTDFMDALGAVLAARGVAEVTWLAPAVREPGAHMEGIAAGEARQLLHDAAAAAGIRVPDETPWVAAPDPAPLRTAHAEPSLQELAAALTELVEIPGVSGSEWAVRRRVLERFPDWARDRAVVDDMGNVFVQAGPDADPADAGATVFIAHLDEVGYRVESIDDGGIVTLGSYPASTAWEGQTALVHFEPPEGPTPRRGDGTETGERWKRLSLAASAPEPLRGVFRAREAPDGRRLETLTAWFGLTGDELTARGVRPGLPVTSYKEGLRLGVHRFAARALDDRAGTLAVLRALHAIDPEALPAPVIFAFSVAEETGLHGAEALAARFGATARRVYSVDTFVTSDTPVESPHFAHTPLGQGPVLRAIESSSVSPDAERDRVRSIAAAAEIPLQIGLTQGGTDGTRFTFRGAPNQGLSWPGRYSHSPGEVLDLRDLARLVDLIVAAAMTP